MTAWILYPSVNIIFCALKLLGLKGVMISKVHGMDMGERLIGGAPYCSRYGMRMLGNLSLSANACLVRL